MTPIIGSLSIERFRALRKLKLDGLGMVNLITGRNNTGKSSFLEALRIMASVGSPYVFQEVLYLREEDAGFANGIGGANETEVLAQFSCLFTGFPQVSENTDAIVLTADSGQRPMRLNISVRSIPDEQLVATAGLKELFAAERTLFLKLAIDYMSGGAKISRTLPWSILKDLSRGLAYPPTPADKARIRCGYVSPSGARRSGDLAALWDAVALTESEKSVVDSLKIIVPEIVAVSMVGVPPVRERTAILRCTNLTHPIPLRSFGDGLYRLFGIMLALVNARDGFLLIDEFENGMHHSVQLDVWRAIFRLSASLNVQVFATSHSWDAVEAFQEAASEHPEQALLIRLSQKGDEIIPTLFRQNELAIASREHIEVR